MEFHLSHDRTVVALEDALKSTIAVMDNNLPVLTHEEWTILKELCKTREPLEEATKIK